MRIVRRGERRTVVLLAIVAGSHGFTSGAPAQQCGPPRPAHFAAGNVSVGCGMAGNFCGHELTNHKNSLGIYT